MRLATDKQWFLISKLTKESNFPTSTDAIMAALNKSARRVLREDLTLEDASTVIDFLKRQEG